MQIVKSVILVTCMLFLGIALLSCASVLPAQTIEPDNTTAAVYFIYHGSGVTMTGGAVYLGTLFSLWDNDTFLSNIYSREYLMLNLKAGTRFIMALSNNAGLIDDMVMDSSSDLWLFEADLAPGKTYYFEIIALPGGNSPIPQLKVIEPGNSEIERYLKSCEQISPKGKVTDSMVKRAGKKVNAAKGGTLFYNRVSADRGI